jgi:hypothetical protein
MPPAPWVIRNTAIETPFATNSLPLMNEAQRAYWEKIYPTAAMTRPWHYPPKEPAPIILKSIHPKKPFAGLWNSAVTTQALPA